MGRQMTYYFEKVFEKFETLIEDHAIASQQADANDYLTGIGEDISCCYYIKSGICRCSILNDNGEELILSWHGPGSLFFIYLRGFPPSGQCIDLSQEEVASILGVSRVQVARVYQRLRKEGIIFSSRKRIQVIHPEGMKIYFEFLNQ